MIKYGLDVEQFRNRIVLPVLQHLTLWTVQAEALVLGTCLQESNLHFLAQLNGGPARGVAQMEKATHDDIWENYLAFRPSLADSVRKFAIGEPDFEEMEGNLYYAIAMCRIKYLRVRFPIPTTPLGMAAYWKQWYNSALGAGTIEEALVHFERACLD